MKRMTDQEFAEKRRQHDERLIGLLDTCRESAERVRKAGQALRERLERLGLNGESTPKVLLVALALSCALGCSGGSEAAQDAGHGDVAAQDAGHGDVAAQDVAQNDVDVAGEAGRSDAGDAGHGDVAAQAQDAADGR